jgi:outer membrane protein TolC
MRVSTSADRRRGRLLAGAAALALLAPLPGVAAEAEQKIDKYAQDALVAAAEELQPTVSEHEMLRLQRVQDAPPETYASGAWREIESKSAVMLHQRAAAVRALEKNLGLKLSRDDVNRFDQLVKEARAIFMPTFTVDLNYTESETNSRTQFGFISKRPFLAGPNLFDVPFPTPPGTQPLSVVNRLGGELILSQRQNPFLNLFPVIGDGGAPLALIFRRQQRQDNVPQRITASKGDIRPDRFLTLGVSVEQRLPWGPSINVSSVTRRQKIYYRGGRDNGKYWDDGMYSTDVQMNFSSGVPFAKNFGPYAPADAALKLAKKDREQSEFQLKDDINSILFEVDRLYWTLVQRLEELNISVERLDLIAQQAARVNRLFDLGRATSLAKAQIDNEVSKAERNVEAARGAYLNASHDLATFVEDSDANVQWNLYLPFGFSDSYLQWLQTDYQTAMQTAKANRPDIQVRRVAREAAEINYKAAKVNARPDLQVDITVLADQDGTKHGYVDPISSHHHVYHPDTLTQAYGLSYVRPLKNKGPRAIERQARLGVETSDLDIRDTDQSVFRDISDRLVSIGNRRLRYEIADREVQRLEEAVAGLERKLEIGADVTQEEIILTTRRLLDARLRRIAALVDNKIEESSLLRAQGILANEYGPRTQVSEFDGKRIELLSEGGLLDHFDPAKVAGKKDVEG